MSMRKFTYLFSMFLLTLCAVGTVTAQEVKDLSELSNSAAYTITTEDRGGLVWDEAHPAQGWCSYNTTSGTAAYEVDAANPNHQWTFFKSEKGNYYLYNVGAKKFLQKKDGGTEMVEVPTSPAVGFINATGANKANYPWVVTLDGSQINLSKNQAMSVFTNWNDTGDKGNMMKITKVADLTEEDVTALTEVVRTFEATIPTYVTDLANLSNTAVYTIGNGRGMFTYDPDFVGTSEKDERTRLGSTMMVSSGVAGATADLPAENLQWAILTSTSGNRYLYNVAGKVFASADTTGYSCADKDQNNAFGTNLTSMPKQSINILNGQGGAAYPWVIAFGENQLSVSNSYPILGGCITFWNDLSDAGNCVRFQVVDDVTFDPTEALARIEAFENGAKVVSITPATTETLEALPTQVVITFDKPVAEVTEAGLRTDMTWGRGTELTEIDGAVVVDGTTVTLNIPEDEVAAAGSLTLNVWVKDAEGYFVGDEVDFSGDAYIAINYTLPADRLKFVGVKEAENLTTPLSSVILSFQSPYEGDVVGGFDESKEIFVRNAEGDTITTGTFSYDLEVWDPEAILTFAEPIVAAGTYTVTVPAATVYNSLFYDGDDDFGVASGAIYNPEFTFNFTVAEGTNEAAKIVSITPDPSETLEALPRQVVVTFDQPMAEVTEAMLKTNMSFRGEDLLENEGAVVVEGNTVTINIAEEYLAGVAQMQLQVWAKDAMGNFVGDQTDINGDAYFEIAYEYEMPADQFTFAGTSLGEEPTYDPVSEMVVNFTSPYDGDMVGGFDTSKVIAVCNEAGDTVTTATFDFTENYAPEALLTFADTISTPGTYTITVPEATVYNAYFDDMAEDFGVSFGAIYNPEFTISFTIAQRYDDFVVIGVDPDPTAGAVASLEKVTLQFPEISNWDSIGKVKEDKIAYVTNEAGETVSTCTATQGDYSLIFALKAEFVLDTPITTNGVYTFHLLEKTVWNSDYRNYEETDEAKEAGAHYNPAYEVTFTVDTSVGINGIGVEGENGNVYNVNGQLVGKSVKGLQKGVYIQNGKKIYRK